jgi:hypothetical protein
VNKNYNVQKKCDNLSHIFFMDIIGQPVPWKTMDFSGIYKSFSKIRVD